MTLTSIKATYGGTNAWGQDFVMLLYVLFSSRLLNIRISITIKISQEVNKEASHP